MGREAKQRELEQLEARVRQLQEELANEKPEPWQATNYYFAYYAMTGAVLGSFGAATSLLFNVVGSLLVPAFGGTPQHPLRLIQVYLTFGMGERALDVNEGVALAVGSCLYLATGMVYGVLFHVAQSKLLPNGSFAARMVLATVLSIALWLVNFYGILSWLQPLLFGGDWIVEQTPWWVAALTHLVFGWTMALVYPLGIYSPYRLQTEQA